MEQPAVPRHLALEQFLPYRLARVAELISRDFATIYRERYGLNRPEWRTLATLGQFGSMTATAIGAHSSMHKTKVSRAVAALEHRGWLKRSSDPEDRRVEHLELTRSGRRAYADLVPLATGFEQTLFARLGPGASRKIEEALNALEEELAMRRP